MQNKIFLFLFLFLKFLFYLCSTGLFFVVDSTDRERVNDARDELHRMLEEEDLREAFLVVYANKKDQPGAMSTLELTDMLALNDISMNRSWIIQAVSAVSGDGLFEGLEWFGKKLKEKE